MLLLVIKGGYPPDINKNKTVSLQGSKIARLLEIYQKKMVAMNHPVASVGFRIRLLFYSETMAC